MTATVLTVNSGSTSVKLGLIGPDDDLLAHQDLDELPRSERQFEAALDELAAARPVDVVAHRVVHGGRRLMPSVVDDDLVAELGASGGAAPLHAAPALLAIAIARRTLDASHVVCFDTAFHHTLPPEAATYAVPQRWRERYGLRRYGFHGLSHAYAARRVTQLVPRSTRLVICHLGGGASLAAVLDGRSVDTTMGFTPLEGLVMNTRSGDVDPGMILWLARRAGIPLDELAHALEHESGLIALAGRQATLGTLFRDADAGDDRAALATAVYVHRLAGAVARMTASLGGLDALVFTGGIGENEPRLRHEVAERLGYLGVEVDPVLNSLGAPDTVISEDQATVSVAVVHAREDLELARAARVVVGAAPRVPTSAPEA